MIFYIFAFLVRNVLNNFILWFGIGLITFTLIAWCHDTFKRYKSHKYWNNGRCPICGGKWRIAFHTEYGDKWYVCSSNSHYVQFNPLYNKKENVDK